MSYSRWSTSVWYTFWTWSGSDEFTFPTQSRKNKQTFEICDLMSYYVTYGELDDIGVDNAIKEIKSFYSKSYDLTLMGDKEPFKKDVNEEEEIKGKKQKISIQSDKGLGEMNPDELWETTMDPEHRILKQVNVLDAQEADKVFDMLMGTDVPSRKLFIQSNAKKATIDI